MLTMQANTWRSLSTLALVFAATACGKSRTVNSLNLGSASAAVSRPAPNTAPSAVAAQAPTPQPVQAASGVIRFPGEVVRGQRFEKTLSSGLVFRLEPYAGDDSGWSLRLAPDSEPPPASIDCIGSVSEPLHGSHQLSIEPSDASIINGRINWFPNFREFYFVRDVADCKSAWDFANAAYYPSKLTTEQREDASEKLFEIPTGHGVFRIIDSKVKAAAGEEKPQAIEWLKFEVELNFSPSPNAHGVSAEAVVKAPKNIHDVDVEKFLRTRYVEVDPSLQRLEEECPPQGLPRIHSVRIQYGDLDGDGQDEAVYEGFTCMSGTAGIDFFGVLKLKSDGKLIALPIEGERKQFKGRTDLYQGLRGHLRLKIKNGRLVQVYPVYENEEDCNACSEGGERQFIYRWDGQQFALDDIIDVPPQKSGT
jgi:hypothetical protein